MGAVQCAGGESSGNYGAALSRYLLSKGVEVFEVQDLGMRLAIDALSQTGAMLRLLPALCSAVVRMRRRRREADPRRSRVYTLWSEIPR